MKVLRFLVATDKSYAPSIARVVLGLVIFPHGAQKMLGWFGGNGFSGTMGWFDQALHISAPLRVLGDHGINSQVFIGVDHRDAEFDCWVLWNCSQSCCRDPDGSFAQWVFHELKPISDR